MLDSWLKLNSYSIASVFFFFFFNCFLAVRFLRSQFTVYSLRLMTSKNGHATKRLKKKKKKKKPLAIEYEFSFTQLPMICFGQPFHFRSYTSLHFVAMECFLESLKVSGEAPILLVFCQGQLILHHFVWLYGTMTANPGHYYKIW